MNIEKQHYHQHHEGDVDAHSPSNVSNHHLNKDGHHHADLHNKSIGLLKIVICLTFGFAIIEAFGGYFLNSLALMSDAAHMFTDSSSLLIALVMAYFAKIPADHNHSYGHGRAEVIGALFNSIFMFIVIGFIAWESIDRFQNPLNVQAGQMIIIASIGLIINIAVFLILSKDDNNMNIKAALLHVIGDLLGSIAAIVAGVVIYFTGWNIVDPILSLLIAVILIPSTFSLIKKSIHVLAEGVPHELDFYDVGKSLSNIPEFNNVHDLHIWTIDSKNFALSAHISLTDMSKWSKGLETAQKVLLEKHNILHVTLQPELVDKDCPKKPLVSKHKSSNCQNTCDQSHL